MMRVFWIEIRRSPMRWALPLLLAMALGMLFGRNTLWIGVWPQASAAAQNPAWLIAPAVAAVAAWSAGRARRIGATDLMAAGSRPGWQREAAHLGATIVYGLIPLALAAAVAAAVSLPDAGPGFLWPSYLLLGATLVCLAAGLGHLIGAVVRSAVAAPAAALAVLLMLAGTRSSFHVLSGPPHLQFATPALVWRGALAAAVVAAAIVIAVLGIHRRHDLVARHTAYAGTAIVAVVVAIAMTAQSGPLRLERPPPSEPLCSSDTPVVCVWPEHRAHLSALAAAAQRLAAVPEQTGIAVPDRFHERGLEAPADADLRGFTLALHGEWPAVRGMVAATMQETFGNTLCMAATPHDADRRSAALGQLQEWLVTWSFNGPKPPDFFGGDPAAEHEANRVWDLPDAQQFRWAAMQVATIEETPCAG
jgi:hypothetical protein